MPSYAMRLDPAFSFARVHGVEAERVETVGDSLVFFVAERVVYQIPKHYVALLETFETRADAMAWMRTESRKGAASGKGGSGLLGAEQPVASRRGQPRQVGSVVEQVVIVENPRGSKG